MYKVRRYLENIKYGTKIIFAASTKYFILKLILSLVLAIFPYIPLLLWRNLLNTLVEFTNGASENLIKSILAFVGLYCVIIFVEKLMDTLSEFVSFKYNDAISYYLDNLMIDKVTAVDLAFFDSSDLNDKLANSWSLMYSIQNIVWMIFGLLQGAVRLIISFVLICTLSIWIIPVVIILCIPSIIGNKKENDVNYKFEKENAKAYRKLEYYKGLFFGRTRNEVKLYNLENYFSKIYETEWKTWYNGKKTKNIKVCIINCSTLVILTLNEIMVYILSVVKLIAGEIAVGDVAYYVSLVTQFRADLTQFCSIVNGLDKNSKEIDDVRSFVELAPLLEKGGTLIPKEHPEIEFQNVSFKYPNAKNLVLQNCSFVIKPGETVGLVGLNGSGKSTIVKLLLRFYDPYEGKILIDGIDIKQYDIVKIRAMFGVLFQDYVQYSFTARKNIAMSDLSRIDHDKDILAACDKSKVTEIMSEWEKGIDENLTRRFDGSGKELSGGQWQRISLARAFFRNAPVVLLDEPSAALDPVAEHDIFEKFSELSNNKSAVLISHRLSSITLTDKILVLEDGHIIEQGSHSKLLLHNGKYAQLFNLQASKYV